MMALRERIAYTQSEADKYRQIISYAIKCGADAKGIHKTKLAKEVCLADFIWFYENNIPMSGMVYVKREYGPVADAFFRIIEEMEDEGIVRCERIENKDGKVSMLYSLSNKELNLNKLNDQEKTLIEQIGETWKGEYPNKIIEFTHNQLPYKICRDGEVIPYSLITQEEPSNVYGPMQLHRCV